MIPSRVYLTLLCGLVVSATPLRAQETFTLEHFRKIVGVGGVELSPDGRTAVIIVTRKNYADDRNESELYAVDVTTSAIRQLTFERRSASSPQFSPDGRTLAFLAPDTAGKTQIWLLPMGGGETRRLTTHVTGVEHYSWRPDGSAIAFAASDTAPKRVGEEKALTTFEVGAQDIFLRENLQPQHIWVVTLPDSTPRRVTSGSWSLEFVLPPGSSPSSLSWAPDGKSIAFTQVVAPESGKLDSVHVAVIDLATGAIHPLTSARRFENNPVFSPDGRSVAYWYPREGRGDLGWVNEVWLAPTSGGAGRSLTRALDRNLFGARWMPDGRSLLVAGNDATTVGAWLQPVDGAPRRLALGNLVVNGAFGYDITVAARVPVIAFTATTPDRPSELYVMDSPTAAPRRLTDLNAWAKNVRWGARERITWATDSFQADGVVTYPPGFTASVRYPLVLLIHGGPTYADRTDFSSLAQLMAAEGWVVFSPNYRGSDGLGNSYEAAIVGDLGEGPGRDVMAGVAVLRQRPYIDRAKTAVTGWSYGGYMTSWLIGHYPTEWQAAMAGAPVTDWVDMYNSGDWNIGTRYYLGGSPYTGDRMATYLAQSPMNAATLIRTPTLVMTNMEDFRVPPTQAFALAHAIRDNGVEVKLIGFTGRTHASGDPVNARERTRLWIDWVQRHLSGEAHP